MLEIEVSQEERKALLEQFNVANAVPMSQVLDEAAEDAYVIEGSHSLLCNRYGCRECPFTKAYEKAGLFLKWDFACERWYWEAFLEAAPPGTVSAFNLFRYGRNYIEWKGEGKIVVETLYSQLEKHLKVRKEKRSSDDKDKSDERGETRIVK